MDYLDTQKESRHRIILYTGYILIAIGIGIAALLLNYQAQGFGVDKKGALIQNGLTFFSSQPNPANIYVNDKLQSSKTNTRLLLPEDVYRIKLTRTGYHDWQRTISLEGGSVKHFDYPLLFPKQLTPKRIQSYAAAPALATQSLDKRWLLVSQSGGFASFDVYDLKNPADAPEVISLPDTLLTKATSNESLQLVEWAADNRHILLKHTYDDKTEFVMIDRTNPDQSININITLSINPTAITLNDRKYDQYYLYDAAAASLQTATLKEPALVPKLSGVLSYKSYGDDTVLYVTATGAPAGKVLVKLLSGSKTYTIRSLNAGIGYLVDLTKYDNQMYVAVGSVNDARVYIYRDPAGQLAARPKQTPAPVQVLRVDQPNYLSFSTNAQYIVAQNGTKFGVYDIENKLGYNYTSTAPLDAPQTHVTWMDGNRLVYVSSGKLTVADYDNMNRQTLMSAVSGYSPAYAPDSKYVYTITNATEAGKYELTQTPLLTPADL